MCGFESSESKSNISISEFARTGDAAAPDASAGTAGSRATARRQLLLPTLRKAYEVVSDDRDGTRQRIDAPDGAPVDSSGGLATGGGSAEATLHRNLKSIVGQELHGTSAIALKKVHQLTTELAAKFSRCRG